VHREDCFYPVFVVHLPVHHLLHGQVMMYVRACTENITMMTGVYKNISPIFCLKDFRNSDFTWKNGPRFNLLFLKARKMLAFNKFKREYLVGVNSRSVKVVSLFPWVIDAKGTFLQECIGNAPS